MPTLLQRLNRPIVALLAVAAIAGGVRFWHISHPPDLVFDELYYAKAGCILIGDSNKTCMVTSSDERYWRQNKWDVGSWVHPPLGKWMIGLGEKAFGVTPFGWRFASALVGTLTAVLVGLIAQLLFGEPLWTFLAGLLLSIEHLNFVQSRVAMLDVHLEFWIVVGFLCLLLDRRWMGRRTPPEPEDETEPHRVARVPSPIWRPWRLAAGIALGAAVSVKWSGAMALIGAVVISYVWETVRRRRGPTSHGRAFAQALGRETFGLVIAFLVLPAAVYMLMYLPWFHHFGWSLKAWWENQTAMWDYHKSLRATALDPTTGTYTPTHAYYSRPWTWLFMVRPVDFYSRDLGPSFTEILSIGNPAIFWASVWTLPYLAIVWRRRRDWVAGFVLMGALSVYLPWFVVIRPQFFFYVLPMTPFLVLAATYVLRDLARATIVLRDEPTGERIESTHHPYLPFVWAYVLVAVALFVWFYPVLAGHVISDGAWRARVWFRSWI